MNCELIRNNPNPEILAVSNWNLVNMVALLNIWKWDVMTVPLYTSIFVGSASNATYLSAVIQNQRNKYSISLESFLDKKYTIG